MSSRISLNYTYVCLFFLIIWDALKHYLGLHSAIIQASYIAPFILIGLLDEKNKYLLKNIFSNPLFIWLVWIIYSLSNTFIFNDINILFNNPVVLGSSIIICFILTAFIVSNNTKTVSIINVLIIAFFVRLCISLVFDSIGLVGDTERFGSEFNANTIGFGTLFIVALVIAKKVYTNKISKFEIFCLIVSVAVIIATASRKNLIALIILGIGYVYINRGRNTVINSIKVSFSILIIAFFSYLVLNNTTMGDRIIRGYEQTMTALESGDEEYMFENRARYYVDGWKYFKNNPINGIGLTNFRVYDERERALHTEYMAQLTEGGIIGASLFLIFYIYILLKLNKIRRLYTDLNKKALLYILFMVVMLFLFTGTWIYRVPIMWVLIALSVRFIYVVRHNKLSRTSKNQLRYQN